jgi:hypothetical protein
MAVGELRQQHQFVAGVLGNQDGIGHGYYGGIGRGAEARGGAGRAC